jgi:hypothetical protein
MECVESILYNYFLNGVKPKKELLLKHFALDLLKRDNILLNSVRGNKPHEQFFPV